jgi:hypothetical protein
MPVFEAPLIPEMTVETKDRVKHEELERVLRTMAKEIRMLKDRMTALEGRK